MSKKKSDLIFRIILLSSMALMFMLSIYISVYKEFWYDEVAIFGYVRSDISLKDMFHYYATIEVTNLPLFTLIAYPLYHLLPANAFCILIPSIVLSLLATYFMVKLVDKTLGRMGAYITLAILLFSRTMISKVGTSYRAYSLMIFGSIFFVYTMYLLYQKMNDKSKKPVIIASVAGSILAYSHYFGVLFLAVTGVGVFVLILMKRMKWKMFIPFVVSAITFVPWFVYAFSTTTKDVGSFWIESPSIGKVASMFGFMLGGSRICLILWGIASVYVIINAIVKKKILTLPVFYTAVTFLITGIIYLYSTVINPGGGLFEDRYFFVIFPYMIFTIVYFLNDILSLLIAKRKDAKNIAVGGLMILAAFLLVLSYDLLKLNRYETTKQYNRFNFFADRIKDAGDIEKEDTLLILNSYDAVGNVVELGWLDYYLIRQGFTPDNVEEAEGDIDAIVQKYHDHVNTIYVFGDTDHFYYDGTDYVITEEYSFEKGIVLKKAE